MIVSKFVHQCRGTARSGRNRAVAMVGPPCAPFFRGIRPGKAGQASTVTPAVPVAVVEHKYRAAVGGDRLTL